MTRPTDEDLHAARWDLQVATGQTVAGTGVEARMREARAAAGRLAAGLPTLLDELQQLRRLPAELADARAELDIYRSAAQNWQDRFFREGPTARAVAAERALEAVRATCDAAANDPDESEWVLVSEVRAALSAASPTTSDEPARTPDLMAALRASFEAAREAAKQRRLGPAATSDEPARCPPGCAEAHDLRPEQQR